MPNNPAIKSGTGPDSHLASEGASTFINGAAKTEPRIADPEQAHMPSGTIQLTAEQVRSYNGHGYLSLPSITTPEEIAEIRTVFEKLFEKRMGENEGAYGDLTPGAQQSKAANSPQLEYPVNYAPKLHTTRCFKNALSIAKQLLGDDARFFLDLSILKAAKVGAGTPWHQDAAFRDPRFVYKEVAVWVPLQEVKPESGCLQFIPNSHKNPIIDHRPVNNDRTSLALECTGPFDESDAVPCPLPVGGCTLHHPGTLHRAGPNLSDVPRFAYIMVFGVAPEPAKELRTFPWLNQREPSNQVLKRRWMRRGGVFITIWRRVRRGDLSSPRSVIYWIKRSIQTIAKGG
jgi:ectoine hydroxylase-related dioxygenase (phytanoyl-CoA dioxygenase family)